jgi:hypothetical protein
VNRELTEEELWALCREGTVALQRKKKHLRKSVNSSTAEEKEAFM